MCYIRKTVITFIFVLCMWFLIACDKTPEDVEPAVETYTVNFNSMGGTEVAPKIVQPGRTIQIPNVSRVGYTLDGWYLSLTGGETFDERWLFSTTTVNNEITLYAKWNVNEYTVVFNKQEGTGGSHSIKVEYDSELPSATKPSRTGYTFGGYYSEPSGQGIQYYDSNMASQSTWDIGANTILYAKWIINQYTINYRIVTDNYDTNIYILLYPGETIISLSLGREHSSTLTSEGRIFTWGYNAYGQLGDGATTTRLIPTEITSHFNLGVGEAVISLSLGGWHSSALTSEGRVFTWGQNNYGQLGDGTTTTRLIPTEITSHFNLGVGETVISLSLGGWHSSALTSEGRVFIWGFNSAGQLGDGTTADKLTPTEITKRFNLDVGETIISLSLGLVHSSVLSSSGRVFTWGYNFHGPLGDGTTADKLTPIEITIGFNLGVEETIISLSLGVHHSSALSSEGRVFTWGWNSEGQLGDGTTTTRSIPTEITGRFDLGVEETVISLSLGVHHSSALSSEGRVFSWGSNSAGQLGEGTTTHRSIPTEITSHFSLGEGETIISISLGGYHSSALTSVGRVFTWGWNGEGQLGDGTTIDSSTQILPLFAYSTLIHTNTYDYNEIIIEYVPALEGYTFSGWVVSIKVTNPYVFSTMPAQDFVLYGYWIKND